MIRWLTPEIGTAPFEGTITTPDIVIIDVRDLVDRDGNSFEVIRRNITKALAALASGHRVVMCCDHGISRSNAIATAVIALHHHHSFDDALSAVLATAEFPEMRTEVLTAVRGAISLPTAPLPLHSSRLLVTGATGGLGGEIVTSAPPGIELFRPSHAELDLTRGPAPIDLYIRKHGINGVLHFAHPRVANTSSSLGLALAMLRNLLDACVANNARILYPSSWHVFAGHRAGTLDASEETSLKPATCLGDTKYLCETLLDQYVDRQGLVATVLRSGLVVGGGAAPHFLRTLCRRAKRGEAITTHRYDIGLPALDLVAASDFTTAAWSLFFTRETGTFHAGTRRLLTTARIAELVKMSLDSTSRLHIESLSGTTCNVRIDSHKLQRLMNWAPRIDVEAAVAQFTRTFTCKMDEFEGHI